MVKFFCVSMNRYEAVSAKGSVSILNNDKNPWAKNIIFDSLKKVLLI